MKFGMKVGVGAVAALWSYVQYIHSVTSSGQPEMYAYGKKALWSAWKMASLNAKECCRCW